MPLNSPRKVQSQEILDSVDEVLRKQSTSLFSPLWNGPAKWKDLSAEMQLDNIINCEASVDLWNKVLCSAISDTTKSTYPHHSAAMKVFNYLLNEYLNTDFGLSIEFFSRLLLLHPPYRTNMQNYYEKLLCDRFIKISDINIEEETLFWFLIDNLIASAKQDDCFNGLDEWPEISPEEDMSERLLASLNLNDTKVLNIKSLVQKNLNEKKVKYFENLKHCQKLKRCLICLNIVCDILEVDFLDWFHRNQYNLSAFKKGKQPLLSQLIWDNTRDIGVINKSVRKICSLFDQLQCVKSPQMRAIHRLMALLAELIRCSDASDTPQYPYLGKNSDAVARDLAIHLSERIRQGTVNEVADLTMNLKPPWFKLLVCTNLLSHLTGVSCTPELISATEILEHLEEIQEEKVKRGNESKEQRVVKADPKLVEKFSKLKSVNSKLMSGKTRLHVACQKNKVEEVRALLTFSELDVNTTDHEGWTCLHDAAFKGSTECVKELLAFRPLLDEVQRPIDTRARDIENVTPLMCAVSANHTDICELLLKHAGSVLLEDVREDNKTPFELATNENVLKVLDHYQKNKFVTENSKKKMHFTADMFPIVADLCVLMIESYFLTHRIWEVYKAMKRCISHTGPKIKRPKMSPRIQYNYSRYHRDIKTNLPKLRSTLAKIKGKNKNLKELHLEPLLFVLFLNKSQ